MGVSNYIFDEYATFLWWMWISDDCDPVVVAYLKTYQVFEIIAS